MLATLVAFAAVVYGHPRGGRYMNRDGYVRGAGRNAMRRGGQDIAEQVAYNAGSSIGRVIGGSGRVVRAGIAGGRDGLVRGVFNDRMDRFDDAGYGRGFNSDVLYRPRGTVYGGSRGGRITVRGSVSGRVSARRGYY